MTDNDVLAIINSINSQYSTAQTLHMLDSEHFDEMEARSRPKRPCGYFTVTATEVVTKMRKVMVPDPSVKFEDHFPSLGSGGGGKKKGGSPASNMIEVEQAYQERVAITNLKRTDLNKLNQKTHLNQLLKAFFWDYGVLTWVIERQTEGTHAGKEVAIVRGPIPSPYGGMTDAVGGTYKRTGRMIVILGGTGGSNYQVITAYPD